MICLEFFFHVMRIAAEEEVLLCLGTVRRTFRASGHGFLVLVSITFFLLQLARSIFINTGNDTQSSYEAWKGISPNDRLIQPSGSLCRPD